MKIKVLWIVNTIFPAPSIELNLSNPVFGGWMYGLAEDLSKSHGIEIAVATTYSGLKYKEMSIDDITYYLLPQKNKNERKKLWKIICNNFSPDVVHIHGTEYSYGLECMQTLPNLNYLVSIQGLLSLIARYYFSDITFIEIFKNITIRDIIKFDTIFQQKKKIEKRSKFEIEYLKKTKDVIGRTKWDYVHAKTINPKLNYHFCNESLRNNFYSATKWSQENCISYNIFLSQAGYTIKGLHQVIKAINILKLDFPNINLRIGGVDLLKKETFKDRIKVTGYGKYLSKLIKKYNIEKNIVFLGMLSEEQMIIEYQKAHVFICPSSIENSSNSLGEAQFIGTPSICTYVGGLPDMVINGETGLLYRFEEIEMLAENIRLIFNNSIDVKKMSEKSTMVSTKRHNRDNNLNDIINIYKKMLTN